MRNATVSRRTGRRGCLLAAAIALMVGAPSLAWGNGPIPAGSGAAMTDKFAYSADGANFTQAVPNLFANAPALVPGEDVEASLWVRNDNAITVDVAVDGQALDAARQQAEVAPSSTITLEPGDAAPLLVRAGLPADAGNTTQNQAWPLRLTVSARESADAGGTGGGAGGTPGGNEIGVGELGSTGTTLVPWQLALMALLVGIGSYVGARGKRRAGTSEDTRLSGGEDQA